MNGEHIATFYLMLRTAHATINHSVAFVVPTGTHTQNIESYWNKAKINECEYVTHTK